jgi:hypothetical protein
MRASNEVTVDRRLFLAAVTRIPRGGLRSRAEYSPRKTLIYADPPMLIVETHAQLGMTLEWARTPTRVVAPAGVEGHQLLMPGVAPVTDRERLEQRAKAPMRRRRREPPTAPFRDRPREGVHVGKS